MNETDMSEFGSFFEVCFVKLVFSPTSYFQLSTFLHIFISCQHHDITAMNQWHALVMIRRSSARKVPVLQGLGSYHLRTCGLMVEASLLQWLTEEKWFGSYKNQKSTLSFVECIFSFLSCRMSEELKADRSIKNRYVGGCIYSLFKFCYMIAVVRWCRLIGTNIHNYMDIPSFQEIRVF